MTVMMGRDVISERKALALELIRKLDRSGTQARLFGGGALSVDSYWDRVYDMPRPIVDIDIIVPRDKFRSVLDVIREDGGVISLRSVLANDDRRAGAKYKGVHLDIYSDPLYLNQYIEFGGRLRLSGYALTRADLLATKLQVHDITEREVQDIAALLAISPLSSCDDDGSLNVDRIVQLCCSRWSFYFASMRSLSEVVNNVDRLGISVELRRQLAKNIESLQAAINRAPKTLLWRLRDRVGPRLKWYAETDV